MQLENKSSEDLAIDLAAEPGQSRDTRLIERAVRKRWPIPDQFKEAIVRRQVAIAISTQSSEREATSAAKCIVQMESQNMEQERRDQPREEKAAGVTVNIQNNGGTVAVDDRRTRLDRIAERLGVAELVDAETDNDPSSGLETLDESPLSEGAGNQEPG